MYEVELIDVEQGTEEWFQARVGVISASRFKEARSKSGKLTEQQQQFVDAVLIEKKDPAAAAEAAGFKKPPTAASVKKALDGEQVWSWSETAKNYAFKLAVERITDEPFELNRFQTPEMKRGNALEAAARARHALEIETEVIEVGIVKTLDGRFGASADGFIGEDGGAEYKCLVAASSLRSVIFEQDISEYIDQIQGGLWLTGRKFWDFAVYAPQLSAVGLDFIRKRVQRDDAFIAALVEDLEDFDILVKQTMDQLHKISTEGWSDVT
jgi:hypothetical protein